MIKVGIIGTGKHGSRYANHICNDVDSLDLAALSRRSVKGAEQAKTWGTVWYSDWQKLVNDDNVEAVISVVPPVLNLAIARECARVGKPLLLEKPLAINGREAHDIAQVMASRKCPLTVGQTLRYNPVIKSLKSDIRNMGELYSIHVNQRLEPSSLDWHDQKEVAGAGVLIHTAVHIFDALSYITGLRVKRVMAASYMYHNSNLEDLVTLLFEMEGGIAGTVDISKVGNGRSGRYEFVCEKGHLYGDQVHGFLEKVTNNKKEHMMDFEATATIHDLLKDWSDFLQGKIKNPITGSDGHYAVEVCDACLLSAESNSWVDVS